MSIYGSAAEVLYQNQRRGELITECLRRKLTLDENEPSAYDLRELLIQHDHYLRLHEKFGPKKKK